MIYLDNTVDLECSSRWSKELIRRKTIIIIIVIPRSIRDYPKSVKFTNYFSNNAVS